MQLQRVVDNFGAGFCGHKFSHCGPLRFIRSVCGNFTGSDVQQSACSLQLRTHIGQHELCILEVRNALAKLIACFDIFHCIIKAALSATQ